MNYEETLEWLFKQLPMYQRDGKSAYKADLNNTHALMEILEHPEQKFKSVHIGGTNGKGSVSHMLASLFQAAGYKTGLYTSPHLKDFRERIRINGHKIPAQNVVEFVEQYKSDFQKIGLSFFEMTVGMAFDYFAKEKVDIAIVEVGMGGRLDSTNVLDPELSIITNISLDHTAFLGETKSKIAWEKAGIIKPNKAILIGEKDPETEEVFKTVAAGNNAPISFANWTDPLPDCDLKGHYQQKNLSTLLSAVKLLEKRNFPLMNHLNALKNVGKNTGLRGRWETIGEMPKVICDTGHNLAGLSFISQQLQSEKYHKLRLVWGMVKDKDIREILNVLPQGIYYLCQPNIPRALDSETMHRAFLEYRPDLEIHLFKGVKSAFEKAMSDSNQDDLVFVGGSTFVVAEVL
tara:strand:+ start:132619 stop:133830 length:1212 start_codon:yes stop_codon:yes gene_type:complete